MKFGLHLSFRNPDPWHRPWVDVYGETLALAVEAERLGLDEIWLSEHHLTADGYLPSTLVVASSIAAITRSIRIGTYILPLPLHNAIRVAEDAASVDIISGGRLDLGLGLGYRAEEFQAFGVPPEQRRTRMIEGVEILQRLLTGGAVDWAGQHYNLDAAALGIQPVQSPVPIFLAARNTVTAERAALYRTHLAPMGGPRVTAAYHARLEQTGADPRAFRIATMLKVIPTTGSREGIWARVRPHIEYADTSLNTWWEGASDLSAELRVSFKAERMGQWVIGHPEEVAKEISRVCRQLQATDLVALTVPPGFPPLEVAPWIDLFVSSVKPILAEMERDNLHEA